MRTQGQCKPGHIYTCGSHRRIRARTPAHLCRSEPAETTSCGVSEVAFGASETLLLISCAATASLASCKHHHQGRSEVDRRGGENKDTDQYTLHDTMTLHAASSHHVAHLHRYHHCDRDYAPAHTCTIFGPKCNSMDSSLSRHVILPQTPGGKALLASDF